MGHEFKIIDAASPEQLDPDVVWSSVNNHSVIGLRGLIEPADVKSGLARLKAQFSADNDRKRHPDDYDHIKNNYQRMCIGMWGGAGIITNSRYYRVFYNPIWDKDIYGMRKVFQRMAQTRNHLIGEAPSFATDTVERGLWSACRIQHYPAGGGFLESHTDLSASRASRQAGVKRQLNLLLVMTRRGEDFQHGGGFVEVDGNRLFYEDHFEVGDLLIYDESNIHGVEDIDPMTPLDTRTTDGRYTAFVTLFKD